VRTDGYENCSRIFYKEYCADIAGDIDASIVQPFSVQGMIIKEWIERCFEKQIDTHFKGLFGVCGLFGISLFKFPVQDDTGYIHVWLGYVYDSRPSR